MTPPEETAGLERVLAEASPLPWSYDLDETWDDSRGKVSTPTIHSGSHKLFDMLGNEDITIVEESDGDDYGTWITAHDGQALANAALIVAAVNALPALLDLARRAEAAEKRVSELADMVCELANDVESELTARYAGMLPQLERQFNRDMDTVMRARALITPIAEGRCPPVSGDAA